MNSTRQRIDWYRTPVYTQQLKWLSSPSDARGLLQAGGHVALVALTGALAIYVQLNLAWYWLIPALILHGTVVTNLAAGVHELVHERVFRAPWLNHTFLYIIAFLNWWNPRSFWLSHNEHHKHTLHQPDDLEVVLPMKLTLPKVIRSYIVDPLGFFNKVKKQIRFLLGRYDGEWEKKTIRDVGPETERWVANWSRTLLIGHGLVSVVSLYFGMWIIPVVVSLGAFYAGGLAQLMHSSQHIGLVDEVNDFRHCCRTIYLNPVFSFLYWNMNYHTEHHMYPAVPCYHLPALHRAIRHDLPHTRSGLLETWVEIAGILYRQKYDPDYQFRIPLPEEQKPDLPAGHQTNQTPPVKQTTAKVWECRLCGFIFDEHEGLPEEGIAPGTRWEDIPEDWCCPVCGVIKDRFQMVEITCDNEAGKPRIEIESINEESG